MHNHGCIENALENKTYSFCLFCMEDSFVYSTLSLGV